MRFAAFVAAAVGALAAYRVAALARSGELDSAVDVVSDVASDAAVTVEDIVVTVKNNIFGTKYDDLINSSAVSAGLPPDVLYKLLYQESRFRPDIIDGRTRSPTGALGIAQFMPATAVEILGSTAAALDPQKAIPGAARYLSQLRSSFGGDLTKAVAAYNWGIGNVKRKGLAAAPKETRNYAMAILGVDLRGIA